MKVDNYFGGCPKCGKTDGYINIGRSHWFSCEKHKTKWCIGSNLFSSWKDETEEEQRAIFDKLGFGNFKEVEPIHDDTGQHEAKEVPSPSPLPDQLDEEIPF